jgi:hypothetical protein
MTRVVSIVIGVPTGIVPDGAASFPMMLTLESSAQIEVVNSCGYGFIFFFDSSYFHRGLVSNNID